MEIPNAETDGNIPHKTRRSYETSVIALKEWIATNNRLPNKRSEDSEEKRLGVFVTTIRTQATNPNCKQRLTADQRQILLGHIPDFVFEQKDEEFEHNVMRVAEVIKALNGIYPSRSDPQYKKEAKFIQHLRSSKNGSDLSIQLTPDRIAFIEQIIPDFAW